MMRFGLMMMMIVSALPAAARDNGQWGSSLPHIRQWFQSLMQPDNPVQSCCGEGDAFEADNWEIEQDGTFVAIVTDGKGAVPNGTRVVVPDRKLKWDAGNPTGHGIIFLTSSFQAICYVTPGGV